MSQLRLALFDMDGTLVDSLGHIYASMAQSFEAEGRGVPDRAAVQGIIGLSLPQAFARLLPDLSGDENAAMVQAYKDTFARMRDAGNEAALSPLFEGVADVLADLHAMPEMLTGVATGKSRRGLEMVKAAHGLTRFVTEQVADNHPSKPHPSMVEAALSETGVAPEHAVIIGDTTYDLEMGRSAGIATIGVAWGYHPTEALAPFADAIAQDAGQLVGLITSLTADR